MVEITFQDWRKSKSKEEKKRFHEKRIFEILLSRAFAENEVTISNVDFIRVYLLANEKHEFSFKKTTELGEIEVDAPYDFRNYLALESLEDQFKEFKKLVLLYIVPVLKELSGLSEEKFLNLVNLSLEQIPLQNYEIVFLVGKTPKKSPSRKKVAILKGVHRAVGFQLYCEVFNSKGVRIANKLLVKEIGNEFVYSRFLGELKWENESRIIVKSRTSNWQETIDC